MTVGEFLDRLPKELKRNGFTIADGGRTLLTKNFATRTEVQWLVSEFITPGSGLYIRRSMLVLEIHGFDV